MLGLQLRNEFSGARLRGTTIDFNNDAKTGALDMEAKDFLAITYPSIDLIKSIKAVAPESNKAVVLVGNRGQGKSHLMAALCHMLSDPKAGEGWLAPWAGRIGQPELATLAMRSKLHVIAEPLHEQRFPYLWDILFARHPKGEFAKGKWEALSTGALPSRVRLTRPASLAGSSVCSQPRASPEQCPRTQGAQGGRDWLAVRARAGPFSNINNKGSMYGRAQG